MQWGLPGSQEAHQTGQPVDMSTGLAFTGLPPMFEAAQLHCCPFSTHAPCGCKGNTADECLSSFGFHTGGGGTASCCPAVKRIWCEARVVWCGGGCSDQ